MISERPIPLCPHLRRSLGFLIHAEDRPWIYVGKLQDYGTHRFIVRRKPLPETWLEHPGPAAFALPEKVGLHRVFLRVNGKRSGARFFSLYVGQSSETGVIYWGWVIPARQQKETA